MTSPTMQIVGPAPTRYRYGVASVAQVVDVADDHEFWDGVTWEAVCPPAQMTPLPDAICEPETGKSLAEPNIDQYGTPFRGYNGLFCKLPGRAALLDRANEVFDYAEWQYIEEQAWAGTAGGSPFLANLSTADLTPVPGTAVSMQEGGGLLSQWLAHETGQQGVVWMPRTLSWWAANKGLCYPVGPTLYDYAGNLVCLASGDNPIGPAADAETPGILPAAGDYWMYATTAVMVRRQTKITPALEGAFDRRENEVFGIVERSYLVLWACDTSAVLVDPLLPAGV
jgi:hypothetical protein